MSYASLSSSLIKAFLLNPGTLLANDVNYYYGLQALRGITLTEFDAYERLPTDVRLVIEGARLTKDGNALSGGSGGSGIEWDVVVDGVVAGVIHYAETMPANTVVTTDLAVTVPAGSRWSVCVRKNNAAFNLNNPNGRVEVYGKYQVME